MKRAALLLALLGAVVAVAAPPAIGGTRSSVLTSQLQTSAALNLFVDSTGNDGNACTSSGTAACLTIQGAIDKIPKYVKHPVTVTVGSGNFAGATITGFNVQWPADPAVGSYILLQGTWANVSPATGTATGTATAGSAGSVVTFGTLTDSGQTWTTDNLKGKFVRIATGTGANQRKVIASNTATAITIVGTWTAPASGSTYVIEEPATVCNAPKDTGATLSGMVMTANSAGNGQCFGIWGNAGWGGDVISLRALKLSQTTAVGVYIRGANAQVGLRWIHGTHTGTGVANAVLFARGGYGSVIESYFSFSATNSTNVISTTDVGASVISVSGVKSEGGTGCVSLGSAGTVLSYTNSECSGTGNRGVNFAASGLATLQMSGVRIHDVPTGIGNGLAGAFVHMPHSLQITSADISTTTTAIDLSVGAFAFCNLQAVTGTGNTTGLKIARGNRCVVGSGVTLTGTTEISLDGTSTTLAALRAASPKALPSPASLYGTAIFE